MVATSDVIVSGVVVIKKGATIAGRYVAMSCAPAVRLALGGDAAQDGSIAMSDPLQWVPLSLRNPHEPTASDVVEVSTPGCFGRSADLTGYISGPPSLATVAAALAHLRR